MSPRDELPPHLARYHRQVLLPMIGANGQERIRAARVFVAGCGALGTVAVDALARAGTGVIVVVDRDVVEITNLQRQVLFTEADVTEAIPKAEAAQRAVARINSDVRVEAHVDDLGPRNAARLAAGCDVIVDGLDNFETRYLLNDLAVRSGVPYVYGGAVGTTGMAMPILPHGLHRDADAAARWPDAEATPCLRCLFPEAPPPGTTATCDTAGVLGPVVNIVASHQVVQTLKILSGHHDAVDRRLLSIDVWSNEWRHLSVESARRDDCVCCGQGRFEFLEGDAISTATSLCGRGAIQISSPSAETDLDLAAMSARLAPFGTFEVNPFLLRGAFRDERIEGRPVELTLFRSGRAIVKGTADPAVARAIYARYVGN